MDDLLPAATMAARFCYHMCTSDLSLPNSGFLRGVPASPPPYSTVPFLVEAGYQKLSSGCYLWQDLGQSAVGCSIEGEEDSVRLSVGGEASGLREANGHLDGNSDPPSGEVGDALG